MWIKIVISIFLVLFLFGAYWLISNVFFLETAPYRIVTKEGDFELRDYPTLPVVTTQMESIEGDSAFGRLFQFIQGENSNQTKIAMTTPVFVDDGQMSFVIPDEVRQQGVPEPASTEVEIAERPRLQVAVYRFSGVADESSRKRAVEELQAWIQMQGLQAIGEPFFAYYDAPFIPGPFRRNEVMFQIE
jgi:hypothetical protein